MPSRLIALTGPLRGQSYPLSSPEMSLGRHRSNSLMIPDLAVSRHHCRLLSTAAGWQLQDLDSRDGTFVNGRPVREVLLYPGDLILISNSTLVFAVDDEPPVPAGSAAVELADLDVDAATAIRFAVAEAARPDPGAATDRAERALRALLAVSQTLAPDVSAATLAERLLEQVLAVVPAERAVLLGVDEGQVGEPLAHLFAVPAQDPWRISRSVVLQVAREQQALVVNDPRGVNARSESLAGTGLNSLLALPLLSRGLTLAVLYLDSRHAGVFSEEHCGLLAAMVQLAAPALLNAWETARLRAENQRLRAAELGHGLIGESPAMRRVYGLLTRAAQSPTTILLLGESGTGKELAARAIHAASPRAERPFVAINCATLSENLLESELFGHEKGAFTGAVSRKPGKLEIADGGTVLLDELGELPLPLQAKLLRVLQERTYERVGGTQPLRVDFRLIAATHRDLAAQVKAGQFRDDLFYRLNVIQVVLPPLRERREDIPLLANHFAATSGSRIRGRAVGLSPATRAVLLAHDWPGNVRELANAIERAVVLGQGDVIEPEDLPEHLLESDSAAAAAGTPYHEALMHTKRQLIQDALRATGHNVIQAAARLGLHPNHLHRLITTLALRDQLGK